MIKDPNEIDFSIFYESVRNKTKLHIVACHIPLINASVGPLPNWSPLSLTSVKNFGVNKNPGFCAKKAKEKVNKKLYNSVLQIFR